MSYLLAAYSVVWILIFAYIQSISSKQKKLDREVETLRKLIEQNPSTQGRHHVEVGVEIDIREK